MNQNRPHLPRSSVDLSYRPPEMIDGDLVARIRAPVLADHMVECEKLVVGGFVGKRLSFTRMKSAIEKAWNIKGTLSMTVHGDKSYILKFSLDEDRVTTLEHGPVFISHSPFFVRNWEPFIEQELENIQAIPVWMTIRKVPVHVFNPTGLSYIASVVGKPLLLDGPTTAKTRMSFARVCVEINPKSVLKKEITVVFDNGYKCTVEVEYAWKPAQCLSCSTFCHSEARCPNKVKEPAIVPPSQVYVPKAKPNPPPPQETASQSQNDIVLPQAEKGWTSVNNKRKLMKAGSNDLPSGSNSNQEVSPQYPPGFEPFRVHQTAISLVNVVPGINTFSVLEDREGNEMLEHMEVPSDPSMKKAPSSADPIVIFEKNPSQTFRRFQLLLILLTKDLFKFSKFKVTQKFHLLSQMVSMWVLKVLT